MLSHLAVDSECARGLTHIVADIIADNLAPSARACLRRSRLVPVPKPDLSVRPIAVGESLLKVAATVLMGIHCDAIREYFGDLQFGVSFPGGAESVVHRCRQLITDNPSHVVCTLDAVNAFNSPLRTSIADALRASPFVAFHHIFDAEYGAPGELVLDLEGQPHVIHSSRGTRQGSTLGGFLFALTIHSTLRDARAKYPTVSVFAYLDDVSLVGPARDVAECARTIEIHLAALGISLNRSKCEWFGKDAPPSGFTAVASGIKVLGAFITHDEKAAVEWIEKKRLKHTSFFHRLGKAPPELAFPVLTVCGVPRMSFLTRVHAPHLTAKSAALFDEQVYEILWGILEVAPSDDLRLQCHLPAHLGGLGVSCHQLTAPLAYAASVASVHQRTALELANATIKADLLHRCPHLARRLTECSRPGSSAWLRAAWDCPNLAGDIFSAALRLRLGTAAAILPNFIPCDGCGTHFASHAWQTHVTGCARKHGLNCASRHAALKKALKAVCVGSSVQFDAAEPREYSRLRCPGCSHLFADSDISQHLAACPSIPDARREHIAPHRSGPDVRLFLHHQPISVDVTVLDPLQLSHSSSTLRALIAERVQAKHRLYGAMVAANREELVVATVTAQGHLCPATRDLLARITANSDYALTTAIATVSAAVIAYTARTLVAAERPYRALNAHATHPAREILSEDVHIIAYASEVIATPTTPASVTTLCPTSISDSPSARPPRDQLRSSIAASPILASEPSTASAPSTAPCPTLTRRTLSFVGRMLVASVRASASVLSAAVARNPPPSPAATPHDGIAPTVLDARPLHHGSQPTSPTQLATDPHSHHTSTPMKVPFDEITPHKASITQRPTIEAIVDVDVPQPPPPQDFPSGSFVPVSSVASASSTPLPVLVPLVPLLEGKQVGKKKKVCNRK